MFRLFKRRPRGSAPEAPRSDAGSLRSVNPLRLFVFGRPVQTEQQDDELLPKRIALSIFSSDAISSVAYATQEVLMILTMGGLWTAQYASVYHGITVGVTLGIVTLLVIVVASYWQTIFAYPSGGGSYIVGRENIGKVPGLVAAAALLVDYVLTVAVSIASGVQNILSTPLLHPIAQDQVQVCILLITVVAYLNMRGLRESGTWFAIPTYAFVAMTTMMIVVGHIGPLLGWHIAPGSPSAELPSNLPAYAGQITPWLLLALVPKAFASGCAAMTGTEAMSNGVPSFREPKSRNAALTLMMMAAILSFLFLGITSLAVRLNIHYVHFHGFTSPPVIEQLSGRIFGRSGTLLQKLPYYAMQFFTMLILVVAANTSFAGFPRLAAILAHDRVMPRQMANVGDKMVFTNGILVLAGCAIVLIVAFHGSVDRLIPLYALGVFTAFTISQSGMVVHWRRTRGPRWRMKATVNGIGAMTTLVVLGVIIVEKGREGAWIVLVVVAIMLYLFRTIERHYDHVRSKLSIAGYHRPKTTHTNTVLVLVPSLHRGVFPSLEYGRSISPDCRGIHIEINPDETPRLRREWEENVGDDIPLVILPSPYRSLVGPLLAYLAEVQKERENHTVTVVVPEFVPGKWWHRLLHNSNAFLVKLYLSHRPGVVVTNVRYFLDVVNPGEEDETGKNASSGPIPSER